MTLCHHKIKSVSNINGSENKTLKMMTMLTIPNPCPILHHPKFLKPLQSWLLIFATLAEILLCTWWSQFGLWHLHGSTQQQWLLHRLRQGQAVCSCIIIIIKHRQRYIYKTRTNTKLQRSNPKKKKNLQEPFWKEIVL